VKRETTAIDARADRLRRAGWCAGDGQTVLGWTVTGTHGETEIHATAPTQAEAWQRAVALARAAGMLGPEG
jgi:hypothetical protein